MLQVQAPPRAQRIALLEKSAGALAHAPAVRKVLDTENDLTAADLDRARRAMELARPEGDADTFLRALALRAVYPLAAARKPRFATLAYRIEWLNTDPTMTDVVQRLALRKAGRLCFAGPPGTGKTALAQHLATTLGLPLHNKKASDLLGMYVGQTEAQLAEAFAEARRDDAVLLLDEADSLIRSRESAVRSWEVTQVNQLLKEMEDHDGIVVLCTNHLAAFDEAVLRRLDLKVRFERLTAPHAREAFIAAAAPLGIAAVDADAAFDAQPFTANTVALGDVAAAMRQAQLRSDAPTAALLHGCIAAEVAAREALQGRAMGFMAALR
jgi:broad-specificity NMP kinase